MNKCNQNCNQGRNCVCGDADNWVNSYLHDAMATIILCFFCGFLGFALGMTA